MTTQQRTVPDPAGTETQAPSCPHVPCAVRSFGMTDRGQVRPANEDHFVIAELARTLYIHQASLPPTEPRASCHRGHAFLVADGMGGHRAGAVASALTLNSIEEFLLNTLRRYSNLEASEETGALRELQRAIQQADARLFEESVRHPEWLGMGATLTLAFAVNWKLFVAHAGDSRCYLFSHGALQQLTQDHTVAAELLRHGALSAEEAARTPFRHVVTNVLGGHERGVKVELHKLALEPGDTLLLCSDGLTSMVPDGDIVAVLRSEPDPQKACERLVAEANQGGGKDNITVIVARFEAG
jgi:protein phosphatase